MAKQRGKKYENHSFFCLNCGKKGIPLLRDRGHLHEKNHRKILYCPHCGETVNHIEIRNMEEAEKFREDFNKGLFKKEAQNSINYIKNEAKKIYEIT